MSLTISSSPVRSVQVEGMRYEVDPKTNQDFRRGVELVKEVVHSCGIKGELGLGFSSPYFYGIGYAKLKGSCKACVLNPLVFLNIRHFCKEMRLDQPSDPRLQDPAFLGRLSSYISQSISRISKGVCRTGKATEFDGAILRLFIRARQDEVKYEKMIRALIGHEFGHIHFCEANRKRKGRSQKKRSVQIRIASLFKRIPSLIIRTVDKRLCFESRRHERSADLFMIEKLGKEGLEGSKFGFDLAKQSFKEMRNDKSVPWHQRLVRKMMISPDGNFRLFNFTHRSFDARYRAMERHLEKINAA